MAAKHEPLTKCDYEALADLRSALRRSLRSSKEAALKQGITPQQSEALLAIHGFPGRNWVTIEELAAQMELTPPSAARLVGRMEAMGLVARNAAKEDRRRVQVSLSAKGLRLLEKVYRVQRDDLRSCGCRLRASLQRATAPVPDRVTVASSPCSMPEIVD